MKFLYPIKKLNLKPWIKYWLLKKTSGESTLKAITISTGTLKKVDISKSLSIKEYYGNTVQNGNPSPQAPVPVQVVKEDNTITINEDSYRVDLGGKNKLDLSAFTTTTSNGITVTPITNNGVLEYLESSGTYSQQTYITLTNTLHLEPNTKYFLSGAYSASARLRLREYASGGSNLSEYFDSGSGISFTTKSNVSYVNVQIVFYTQNNVKFYPQIELGTVATPYSPYTDNPIELCKIGNYQDKLLQSKGNNLCSNIQLQDANNIRYYFDKTISQTFTFSTIVNVATANNSIYLVVDGTNYGRIGSISGTANTIISGTYTLSDENYQAIQNGNECYLLLYKSSAGFTLPNYGMLNKGTTALPYEPYGVGKWYLHKEVGKVILNGTETWGGTPNYFTSIMQNLIAPTPATERIIALSNNFLVQGYNYKSSNNLYFHPNKNLQIENPNGTYYATVNDWKTWLSTHNTTVYYVLATPTTETITNTNLILQLNALYEFYVQSSTVSISNDSEIPFEFLLEYYGR